jgi:hypothetical protein
MVIPIPSISHCIYRYMFHRLFYPLSGNREFHFHEESIGYDPYILRMLIYEICMLDKLLIVLG